VLRLTISKIKPLLAVNIFKPPALPAGMTKRISSKFESEFSQLNAVRRAKLQNTIFPKATLLYALAPQNVVYFIKDIIAEEFTAKAWRWASIWFGFIQSLVEMPLNGYAPFWVWVHHNINYNPSQNKRNKIIEHPR